MSLVATVMMPKPRLQEQDAGAVGPLGHRLRTFGGSAGHLLCWAAVPDQEGGAEEEESEEVKCGVHWRKH